MAVIPGEFYERHAHRPMINITVAYPKCGLSRPIPFVIDTGADFTVVVPQWEDVLCRHCPEIAADIVEPLKPIPVYTIGGIVYLRFLPACTLVFTDRDLQPYQVGKVGLSFFSRQFGNPQQLPLTGKEDFPNILGRDVLGRLSLGYSQTSKCLFVTEETQRYREALDLLLPASNGDDVTWLPEK